MSDKFTQQDLADLLAQRHEMEQADAEAFVKVLFSLIEESIVTDKYVKVKGLGTFKLIDVDARESVNVNTGERIEIQGHSRISFTPDTWMRETVNKPFEHFETVLLNEGTRFDDMDEVSSLEEDTDTSEEDLCEEVSSQEADRNIDVDEKLEIKEDSEKPIPNEICDKDVATGTLEEEAVREAVEPAEEAVASGHEATETIQKNVEPMPEGLESTLGRKFFRFPWCMIATVLLVGVVLGGIIVWSAFSGRRYIPESVVRMLMEREITPLSKDTAVSSLALQTDSVSSVKQAPEATRQDTVHEVAVSAKPETEEQVLPTAVKRETLADTVEYMITGTRSTYTIKSGESLVRVALKFYGNKKLWPYLVQYNKDIIKNANVVPVGTTIRIPELAPKKVDRK